MKIALATYSEKLQGTNDDQLLQAELISKGHLAEFAVWSDPRVAWSDYDLVIIRSTWDYYHHQTQFLAWIKKISLQTQVMNSIETITWNSSKEYLLELEKANLPVVPTILAKNKEQGIQAATKLFASFAEIVIKPTVSASADLTFRIQDQQKFDSILTEVLQRGPALLQPFVRSITSDGEISLILFGSKRNFQFSHAIRKIPKQGDFRVQSDHGGSIVNFIPSKELIDLAYRAIESIPGDFNFLRVDLVDWKTHAQIGELELIEPDLFFRYAKNATNSFSKTI